ncbi:MAG TPA: hypothetical protein VFE84_06685, partial [Patescibacteria group bacterium]|nr:hypothetical protein [Patescibacteria group bacterium]
MNPNAMEPRPPYELRVPSGGLGARDPRTTMLMWGVGSIFLGLTISYMLTQGMFRPMLLLLLTLLGLACLSPRRAVFILTLFLPFMYFIRRVVLVFEEFSERDPVLLFPAITTVAVCLGILIFYSPRVFHYFRHSSLMKAAVILMAYFTLEIFNPLQGSILIGLAGAMYFVVPMLWVLLGLMVTREDIDKVFRMVFVIGCLTAVYGVYQHFFGLNSFEIYELRAKHFLKTFGTLSEARVMSTFSGLVDFARYLTISAFITFAYFWRKKRALTLVLLFIVQMFAMLYTASRTSFLVTFFSVIMLMILSGGNIRQILVRGVAGCVVVLSLYAFVYQYDPQRAYGQDFSSNPFVVHTLSGVTHPT